MPEENARQVNSNVALITIGSSAMLTDDVLELVIDMDLIDGPI